MLITRLIGRLRYALAAGSYQAKSPQSIAEALGSHERTFAGQGKREEGKEE
jgi:hypothetical protein